MKKHDITRITAVAMAMTLSLYHPALIPEISSAAESPSSVQTSLSGTYGSVPDTERPSKTESATQKITERESHSENLPEKSTENPTEKTSGSPIESSTEKPAESTIAPESTAGSSAAESSSAHHGSTEGSSESSKKEHESTSSAESESQEKETSSSPEGTSKPPESSKEAQSSKGEAEKPTQSTAEETTAETETADVATEENGSINQNQVIEVDKVITQKPDIHTVPRVILKGTVTISPDVVAAHFNSLVGASYPKGKCLAFVADVWHALGATRSSTCCAFHYATTHLLSKSMEDIPIGADVYFGGCGCGPCDSCGSSNYGHIGVYVGDGYFVHATGGRVQKSLVSSWSSKYLGWGYHSYIDVGQDADITEVPSIEMIGSDLNVSTSRALYYEGKTAKISWEKTNNIKSTTVMIWKDNGSKVLEEKVKGNSYKLQAVPGFYQADIIIRYQNGMIRAGHCEFRVISRLKRNFYAAISSQTKSMALDANLVNDVLAVDSYDGLTEQLWHFVRQKNGGYKIINMYSCKVLAARGDKIFLADDKDKSVKKEEKIWYIEKDMSSSAANPVSKVKDASAKTKDSASEAKNTSSKTKDSASEAKNTSSKTKDSASEAKNTSSETKSAASEAKNTLSETKSAASETKTTDAEILESDAAASEKAAAETKQSNKTFSAAGDMYHIYMGTMEEGIRYFNIKGGKWKEDKSCSMKEDPVNIVFDILEGDAYQPGDFAVLNESEAHMEGGSMMISWSRAPYTFRYEVKVTHSKTGEVFTRKTRVNGCMLKDMKIGEYTIEVTAHNNCGTKAAKPYKVQIVGPAEDLSSYTMILDQSFFIYNKEPQYPQVSVSDGEQHLEEGVDYTVMYADTVEPGIATVKVIGIGRYTGTIEGEYRIIVKPFWKRFIIDAE